MDVVRVAVIIVIACRAAVTAGIRRPAIVIDIRGGRRRLAVAITVRGLAVIATVTGGRFVTGGFERRVGSETFRPLFVPLQHRVFEEVAFDFLLHFDCRQLQQLDRLLELGS